MCGCARIYLKVDLGQLLGGQMAQELNYIDWSCRSFLSGLFEKRHSRCLEFFFRHLRVGMLLVASHNLCCD